MSAPCDRWTWQHVVMSEYGPESATTRLVLLAVSMHMNPDGASAWPSQETLAKRSGLSERSVGTHLREAERAGWVHIWTKKRHGHDWRLDQYGATIPDSVPAEAIPKHPWAMNSTWRRGEREERGSSRSVTKGQEPLSSRDGHGVTRAEIGAEGQEPDDRTSGISRQKVGKEIPTTYSSTSPMKNSEKGGLTPTPAAGMQLENLAEKLSRALRLFPDVEDEILVKMFSAHSCKPSDVEEARKVFISEMDFTEAMEVGTNANDPVPINVDTAPARERRERVGATHGGVIAEP